MSNGISSVPAPESEAGKALAELEKEGHIIGTERPDANDGEIKDTPKPTEVPKVEDKPKEETPKEEKKPDRTPSMVEAWKLKVAEDQKDAALAAKAELEAKLAKMSEQKTPVTQAQQDDISEEIKALAKDKDLDVEFLTEFAKKIMSKTGTKNSPELETTVKKLQEERELSIQLNEYSNEFEKDVLPLLKDHSLTGEDLSKIRETLKNYAFSETYAKVPLKEIFAIKNSEFNLSTPKKSSEGKGIKSRATDTIDIDNISDEEFSKLPPEKIEEFMKKKSSGSWSRK